MSSYRLSTYVLRVLSYLLLFFLLILIIVPIWILIVNSTRSTTEIQQGISLIPSSHLIANYRLLLS